MRVTVLTDIIESPRLKCVARTEYMVEVMRPEVVRHPTENENPHIRLRGVAQLPRDVRVGTGEQEGKHHRRQGDDQPDDHVTGAGEILRGAEATEAGASEELTVTVPNSCLQATDLEHSRCDNGRHD
jgi:hypothetical protein